jgi:mono/diheme cytochrome c family protein
MMMRWGFIRRFAVAVSAFVAGSVAIAPGSASAQANGDVVVRGEYLATAGNCISCHTAEGGEPFAGGVLFQTPFGAIYSTNITPDEGAGIGLWTEDQFKRAMREGVRADGAHLYPAFPYPSYAKVTDDDISAIWTYLQTVTPSAAPATPNELSFPFNQRWLMGAWNAMFFKPGPYEANPEKSDQWNRGAYLVEGLAHCGACHTPRNNFGAEIGKEFLSGGELMDRVGADGPLRPWYAVNLTPSPSGLHAWSAKDLADYLKTGISARAGAFGPMNEVISNSTRHLTQDDIDAIAAYLVDLPAIEATPAKPSDAQIGAGETLYDIHCGTCHLPTGLGSEDSAPSLAGSAIVNGADPSSLINVMLYGAVKPRDWIPPHWEETMEGFGDELRDDEVASIANYVRGSWGNAAGAVTPEDVVNQR